jgi:hypothetical protein
MEILNNAQATPQRFHALLKLVNRLQPIKPIKRSTILELLQPDSITNNQEASTSVLNFATNFSIVIEQDGQYQLHADVPAKIDDLKVYRRFLQERFTGVTDPNEHNYLLNLFTAWVATQDERILALRPTEIAARFNEEVSGASESTRSFNETKFNGWRNWATFLGWGKIYPETLFQVRFAPDASERLLPLLPELIPGGVWMHFDDFMLRLAERCPELDGGSLFEQCWEASRPTESRGTRLSLMLSTGLRTLEGQGLLELRLEADTGSSWYLAQAQGMINRVSHIRWVSS